MRPGSGSVEGSSWEGQNFHSNSEVVVSDEGEEEDVPRVLLICSTVMSISLCHVFCAGILVLAIFMPSSVPGIAVIRCCR